MEKPFVVGPRGTVECLADAHPDYEALDLRRECYRAMRRHFKPFLFSESPFYFEAGVNGGWIKDLEPARGVNSLCKKFYKEQALVPDEEFRILGSRNGEALALCCGPFSDDMLHVPPLRTILAKGFGGVCADVAAALGKCPEDDPHGRKQLETALAGLDTMMRRIHDEIDGFRNDQGGPYRLAVYAYREFMYWGMKTKATPDGRHDGDRLAQGFSPSEYRCKEGITTVINAIGELPHEALYASNAPDGLFGHAAGPCNVIVGSVDFDCGEGTLPEVSRLVWGVSDPENRLRGSLVHHAGFGNPDFPVNGARHFKVTRFGEGLP